MEIFIGMLCAIGLYLAYEMVKYKKQIKQNEKSNTERALRSNKKKKKSSSSAEATTVKAPHKSKPKRTYKKKKKSIKPKTND
tara:strand:+ start:2497 stop:2742 length:246 start_codon:yes stop_codon:yes gene_type:complete